jgi:hypothetical protein
MAERRQLEEIEKRMTSLRIVLYSIYSALVARGPVKMAQMVATALRDKAEDNARGLDAHGFVDSARRTKGHPSSPYANYY